MNEIRMDGSKYRRVLAIHTCVLLLMLTCASYLSWMVWAYKPENAIESIETLLYSYFRWIVPIVLFSSCIVAAGSPVVLRTLRRLRFEANETK